MNIQEVTLLQALYHENQILFYLPVIAVFSWLFMANRMWVYARTGRTSFSGNIVFAVFSMIAFLSSGYIVYSKYKDNHYSMTVLQSELKSIEVTQPNLYNKAAADSLLTSYAKCYESGHVGQTNSKNIMGCPRQYFFEEYLPDVVYTENRTVLSTNKDNEESSSLWIWIAGIVILFLIFRKKNGTPSHS